MVSKHKIIKIIALFSIISMSFASLIFTLGLKTELTQYKALQSEETTNVSDDDTQSKIQELELTIKELSAQINAIPIDETLKIKNKVYEWIEIFYQNQANHIDVKALAKVMYLSSDDKDFYSPENLEKTAIMFTSVFHEGGGIVVELINNYNHHYRINTIDGHSFDITIQDGTKISSPWNMAYKTDGYIHSFVKELKAKNKEILYQYITYEAYDWTTEDFESAYEKHLGRVSKFNLDSIGYSFVGITQDGFRYEIYDRKTQEKEYLDVSTADGILLIKNSNYQWGE